MEHVNELIITIIHVLVIQAFRTELTVKFVNITNWFKIIKLLLLINSKVNPCWTLPCQHGGSCTQKGSNYTCKCISSVYGPNCEYYRDKVTNSTILSVTKMQNLKILINLRQNQTLKMIYQASKDGFSSGVFHTKCNGVLGTLLKISI